MKVQAADGKQDPGDEQVEKLHQKSRDVEVVTAKYIDTRRLKIAMRGEVGIIVYGGDRGGYWKQLGTHWKRYHRRDDKGTGTG